jgi:hypothetical protein
MIELGPLLGIILRTVRCLLVVSTPLMAVVPRPMGWLMCSSSGRHFPSTAHPQQPHVIQSKWHNIAGPRAIILQF